MSKHKAAGKTRQNVRRTGKRLGVKVSDGQNVTTGSILVKQKGTKYKASDGVEMGRDHTLFAGKAGRVKFGTKFDKTVVGIVSK